MFVAYELDVFNFRIDVCYKYDNKLEYKKRDFSFTPPTIVIVWDLNIQS